MMDLKTGDCFLVHRRTLLGKMIDVVETFWSKGDKCLYSHAGLIIHKGGTTLEVLQPRVASQNFYEAYSRHQVMVVRYTELTGEKLNKGISRVYQHYGHLYPYWRLPLEGLRLAKFVHWNSVFCSELVAQFLWYVGARDYHWFGVDPEDLEEEFRHWKNYQIIFEEKLP
jgi:hypothetical protein